MYLPGIQSCFDSQKLIIAIHRIIKTKEKKITGLYQLIQKKHLTKFKTIHDKNTQKNRNRENFLKLIKTIFKNPAVDIILNSERLTAFPQQQNRARMSIIPLLFNMVLEVIATAIRQENKIKVMQIRREVIKLSLSADDMIVHVENPKLSKNKQTNLLELTIVFNKVAGYVNLQKPTVFLFMSTWTPKTKNTIQLIITHIK